MVMDPTFLEGLPEGPDGDRAKEFIKGACNVLCIDATGASAMVTGQVTLQDGTPVAKEVLIYARTIGPAAVAVGVNTGTLIGGGTATGTVFKTDASGAFAIGVSTALAVVLQPDGGETKIVVMA